MANNSKSVKSVKSEETNSVRFQIGSHAVFSAPSVLDFNATVESFAKWLADNQTKLEASYKDIKPALTEEQALVAKKAVLTFFTKAKNPQITSDLLVGVIYSGINREFPIVAEDSFTETQLQTTLRSSIGEWVLANRVEEKNVEGSEAIFVSKKGRNGGFCLRSPETLRQDIEKIAAELAQVEE